MADYENEICPVCGKPFDKNSDIVVCPECGTPHHRRCWDKLGHCANRDKHRQGYEWKPEKHPAQPAPGTVVCPKCGAVMPAGTQFCENCGTHLTNVQGGTAAQQSPFTPPPSPPYGNNPAFDNEAYNQAKETVEKSLAGEIDGVPVKDLAVYIGPNSYYYISKFRRMDRDPKYKPFCFSAFMFTPLYYLYRKMWKYAAISAVYNFIMNIPYMIVMANQMGLLPSSSPFMFNGISNLVMRGSLLVMVAGIYWGFKAVPLYRKQTTEKLKELKASSGGDQNMYAQLVTSQSGPSKLGMAMVFFFAIYYLISVLFAF